MPEPTSEQLNGLTENERSKEISRFTNLFAPATRQIAGLFGDDAIETEIYDRNFPVRQTYFIHGSLEVVRKAQVICLWKPFDQVFERYDLNLTPTLRGQDYGTKIDQIMENIASALGAKKFVLSAIGNERWKTHLLKNGFHPEPNDPAKIFKTL
jgi:GNAT superfamily N-acetyltransferase